MSNLDKLAHTLSTQQIDLDHPDETVVLQAELQGKQLGLTPQQSFEALIAAQELHYLSEYEETEGGDQTATQNTPAEALIAQIKKK